MHKGILTAACAAVLLLAACSGEADTAPGADTGTAADTASAPGAITGEDAAASSDETTATPATSDARGLVDKEGNPIALVAFDSNSVPLSTATLGELPFFSMPDSYGPVNPPRQRAFARFPFRLGDGLHWVEGASWNSLIGVAREARRDKEFSPRELRRNLEAVFEQAGAKKVFEGPLVRDLYYGPQLEDEIAGSFHEGVNLDADTPTTVHVIRQADRTIWLQLSTHSHGAALVVVEERPFTATARWSDEFPYLTLPAAYDDNGSGKQRDFDMYPFWTGDTFEEVEGRTFTTAVRGEERSYSMYEVRRNIEAMMAEAGGTRVFEGRIPEEASERYDGDLKGYYSRGTGFSWDDYDSLVYRVNRPDGREVWVHARLEYLNAGWVVAEREGFVQTAALLPASQLKQQLDAEGRVAIEVNFAVDRADILPDSQPQIAQVLTLLQGDPSLRLSIDGHTDATGEAAHNQRLSEARAQAVVAALTGEGIDAPRLQARGHGQSKPVADNDTDEGRAKNRRVELVRL
ncbi:OmpA family protein [Luteimonas yindakuii]|uniref:OmpA family protein n=1 Tax=Luteimonas yindakuii TaxID=2565782 RepID=UPI0011076B46|nr:OmpA family protein [Luteimonas yindakuii]QCU72778.1 OmpA family protein [Luteimonas yindakuii]